MNFKNDLLSLTELDFYEKEVDNFKQNQGSEYKKCVDICTALIENYKLLCDENTSLQNDNDVLRNDFQSLLGIKEENSVDAETLQHHKYIQNKLEDQIVVLNKKLHERDMQINGQSQTILSLNQSIRLLEQQENFARQRNYDLSQNLEVR